MRETNIDWIFQGPACAVLLINLMFLFRIMWVSVDGKSRKLWKQSGFSLNKMNKVKKNSINCQLNYHLKVLITKLRSANTVETRQYRKASKALLVLIPLLGITYLVVLAGPNEGVGSYIFVVARAFLLSTQVMNKHPFHLCDIIFFSLLEVFRVHIYSMIHEPAGHLNPCLLWYDFVFCFRSHTITYQFSWTTIVATIQWWNNHELMVKQTNPATANVYYLNKTVAMYAQHNQFVSNVCFNLVDFFRLVWAKEWQ